MILNGPEIGASDSLPSTLNLSFPGCRADLLLVSFDLVGVACSTGSACSSGSLLPSTVIQSLGVTEDVLRSAIRLSFSPEQELATLDEAINRIIRAVRNTRQPRHLS